MLDRSTSSWYSLSDQVEDVNGLKPYNEQRSLLFKDGVPTSFCFGQINLHHLKGRKERLFGNELVPAVESGQDIMSVRKALTRKGNPLNR